ncbi:MAG: UpxY family transcription antiterminator [Chlorobiaceae bacterium]|nr:UpxY family transcription antiterminator [Chlorobiaceae bacterium]
MEHPGNVCWYALYVRSRFEKKVHQQLQEKGVTSFLPLIETVRQWSDRKKRVEEPLFRGYVFVNIDHHTGHVPVLETEGVVRFIGIGRNPSVIAERDIEWLRRLVREPAAVGRIVASIPAGKRVRVLAGPFKDFEGTVIKAGREDRLVVFFDSIMQGVEITILPELLTPIDSTRSREPQDDSGKRDEAGESVIKHFTRP